jgi:hypothetical protein
MSVGCWGGLQCLVAGATGAIGVIVVIVVIVVLWSGRPVSLATPPRSHPIELECAAEEEPYACVSRRFGTRPLRRISRPSRFNLPA